MFQNIKTNSLLKNDDFANVLAIAPPSKKPPPVVPQWMEAFWCGQIDCKF
jgi:hypothetical protein